MNTTVIPSDRPRGEELFELVGPSLGALEAGCHVEGGECGEE
jgi:hypothetical protein